MAGVFNNGDGLLSYEQALGLIESAARPIKQMQTVALDQCLKRVTATPLKAGFDLPRFNNSAVDGYGVIVDDLKACSAENAVILSLAGEVAAGGEAQGNDIAQGQCVRILTGAPVPDTVEAIVMKEYTQVMPDGKISLMASARIGENIRMQGEEMETGSVVLQAGTSINPPIVGLIATLGLSHLDVVRQPKIAIISTGDELKEPGKPIADHQIFNSNSWALQAAFNGLGFTDVTRHHVPDDRQAVTDLFKDLLQDCDLIVSAGGVSVGEYDYVKDVCESLGVETVFWRTAIKPGKPVYFGKFASEQNAHSLFFGLPGNPVSALVTFDLFIKPALGIIGGASLKTQSRTLKARLARSLKKKAGRLDFVRAIGSRDGEDRLHAMPTSGQDSHMLTGLAKADLLVHFARESEFVAEGDVVDVHCLDWFA